MARRKSQETVAEQDQPSAEVVEVLTQAQNAGAAIIEAAKLDNKTATAFINQRIGRKQAYGMVSKLLTVADLVDLQNIKDSKGYKGFIAFKDGNPLTISTWDEYCEAVEGRSRQTIDNELLNLNALGPELFESMRTVGIGPGTMRQIRQLPEDKIALLEQVKDTADKDEIAEIIEALIDRNTKEKTDLSKKLDDAQADLEAKDAVAETNAKRINELQEQVARIKKLPPDELDVQMRSEISKLVNDIDHDVRVNLFNGISELISHAQENDLAPNDFIRSQIEQLESVVAFLRENLVIGVEWEGKGE